MMPRDVLASSDDIAGQNTLLQQTSTDTSDILAVDDSTTVSTTSTQPLIGNIHFLQLNLQHSKTASAILQSQVAALECAVILVQELWMINNRVAGLRSKNVSIYCGTTCQKPRTCVLVKGLSAYNMQQYGSNDVTTVDITYQHYGRTNSMFVASIYMPIDRRVRPVQMEELLKYS